MMQTVQTSSDRKFGITGMTNMSSMNNKELKYKPREKELPSDHPNHDYNWLTNRGDLKDLMDGQNVTPVFDKSNSRYQKRREI